jgi:hypothetical protein
MKHARTFRTALVAVFLCLSFAALADVVLPTEPIPVPGRISGSDIVSDQADDGEDSQTIDIDLTWTHPNVNVDNSPLLLANIIGYTIEHIAPLEPPALINVGVVQAYTIVNAYRGPHFFRIRTVATHGTSDWSAYISVQVL